MATGDEIFRRFTSWSEDDEIDAGTEGLTESVDNEVLQLALKLNGALPESREKSLALTKLEEVYYWAAAATDPRLKSED
ncbi:hypothetical protein SEA_SYDNAT_48 [Mycobacterium phage SydNat]|uniref:Acb2/Tad1 hairpin domain-containing protein n=2 Tax=Benedictvirus TaxID=2946819 RepID=A0A5Q2WFC6_9CAUD|nr:hypothetical protein KIP50_gp44 [Mycobacterium phage Zolita]YP_010060925.1 hypothetical protein KIP51_gp44 [Mycobacterium phage Bluefalcon]UVK64268.1 hypothetical protein SEA_SYDNAT_48 [Mycobacterium phage SydNat]UVK64354.1 hypothetical protein SEA_GHOULBOY_48 [Mycobacterium phage Ghoulboy]QDK03131.1 hypothetical protein SEA_ZOLITA_47 [Mycobacterium phage Zolita]QGH75389.1 hypothetical protein SEA_BLUEFALCON_44 [Mycobacterium phage Bluefalcon]